MLGYDGFSMIKIPVNVKPRPYAALIENGLLAKAGALLRELLPPQSRLFVVTVSPVRRKWGKALMGSLSGAGFEAKILEVDPRRGEAKLSIRALKEDVEKQAYQQYRAGVAREAKFGTFADLMKAGRPLRVTSRVSARIFARPSVFSACR